MNVDRALMFNEPSLRAIVLAGTASAPRLGDRFRDRPWVEVIDAGAPLDAVRAMRELHARGIGVLSAVGGRQTATWLLRAAVVSDLYLTTSPRPGGEPGTPLYEGPCCSLPTGPSCLAVVLYSSNRPSSAVSRTRRRNASISRGDMRLKPVAM